MYTRRWWTPVKEGIDDVAQTGKCEYWPRLTNHVAYWKRRSIVLERFLSYGTSLSFPAVLVVMIWFLKCWRCRAVVEFEIAVSGKRTASSWPTAAMVVKGCSIAFLVHLYWRLVCHLSVWCCELHRLVVFVHDLPPTRYAWCFKPFDTECPEEQRVRGSRHHLQEHQQAAADQCC